MSALGGRDFEGSLKSLVQTCSRYPDLAIPFWLKQASYQLVHMVD